MKQIITITLCMLLMVSPIAATGEASKEPLSSNGPELSAASAVLMEKETGALLLAKEPDQQLEPASVTKVMTLLLVMEAIESGQISKDDMVSVSAHAAGMGGSQVFLKEGEQMSVWELVKCVTVVSGNDAAVALAEHVAGSEPTFVERMNQKAAQLGMFNTTFLNCTGLPAAGHVTTAYDIALMSRELILKHPDIQEFTTIWMDTIRDGAFGLTNTNRLIRFYSGATGLKTGSTDSALYCMSATAQRDGMELIAVVMKAPTSADRFADAQALLDFGFANYGLTTIYPDAALPPVEVILGESTQVQPQLSRDCRLLLAKTDTGNITTNLSLAENVEAPVDAGQTLGQFQVYVGGELKASIPIVATQPVSRLTMPKIFTRMLRTLLTAQ